MNARAVAAFLLPVAACAPAPVEWAAPSNLSAVPTDDAELALVANDSMRLAAPAIPHGALPAGAGCASTRRVAVAPADSTHVAHGIAPTPGAVYAAWWRVRPDSSAELLVAKSESLGRTWSAPTVAESRDRSTLGCDRPAPALAIDPRTGSPHVAYWATLPDGPGIFFSHATSRTGVGAPSLPPEHLAHLQQPAGDTAARGGAPDVLWHAAVAVVHGERPSRTSVAARGDTVAVAFEDPNSGPRPRIALAWSRQMGHIFDLRDHAVSTRDVAASHPLVALDGARVAVAWRETERPGEIVARVGRVVRVPTAE